MSYNIAIEMDVILIVRALSQTPIRIVATGRALAVSVAEDRH